MELMLAPLEGVTGYIYRGLFDKYFGGVDTYVTPFISPTENNPMTFREEQDILPENNRGMNVVPQLLVNSAEYFILSANKLKELGYSEVNLNLGCPSGTVITKKKGSGMLTDLTRLDKLLEDIFEGVHNKLGMRVSVKTRLGKESVEEFADIFNIYKKYPISVLTIHPRIQKEFYKGECHRDVFMEAAGQEALPLCYNGDINSVEDYRKLKQELKEATGGGSVIAVMIGRGAIRNPMIFNQIKAFENGSEDPLKCTGGVIDRKQLRDFHDELYAAYEEYMSGERNVLFRMKDVWNYLGEEFGNPVKKLKKIRKAQTKLAYFDAIDELWYDES